MQKWLSILFIVLSGFLQAQVITRHDAGLNLAGLVIKNQSSIAPSIYYKYWLKNFQLRTQLSFDGNFLRMDRNSNLASGITFDKSVQDSSIKYEPGKYIKYGLTLGIMKTKSINNSLFSYYYGLDLFYMKSDFKQVGSGTIKKSNFGFDQNFDIKVSNKSVSEIYGLAIPLGINYKFGKHYYVSLETKFVLGLQSTKNSSFSKSTQEFINQGQSTSVITTNESITKILGIDAGHKPLSGICIGTFF